MMNGENIVSAPASLAPSSRRSSISTSGIDSGADDSAGSGEPPDLIGQSRRRSNSPDSSPSLSLSSSELSLTSSAAEALPTVHILVGALCTEEDTRAEALLATEFGKMEAVDEIRDVLIEFGYTEVRHHVVTLDNVHHVVAKISAAAAFYKGRSSSSDLVVLNLCDGTELDGYPGLSVTTSIERAGLAFTGADARFFDITTSKPRMKRVMLDAGVPTARFLEFRNDAPSDPLPDRPHSPPIGVASLASIDEEQLRALVGPFPFIVKPAVSYASIGITDRSVVWSVDAMRAQVGAELERGRGASVFVERFLAGREFTALVVGDASSGVRNYPVTERVFNKKLSTYQRFLAFDRYWAGYSLETERELLSEEEAVFHYERAPEHLQERLQAIARAAFVSLGGNGYARVDMRSDDVEATNVFVLEVNSQCGISFSDTSSVGEVLKFSDTSKHGFANELVQYALRRGRKPATRMVGEEGRR